MLSCMGLIKVKWGKGIKEHVGGMKSRENSRGSMCRV